MWCSHLQLSLALHVALNHRDKNITAAYLRVRPRLAALPLSPHLHFVARAKHCRLKSHSNLPPYGRSPQKVPRQSHMATICMGGERDVVLPAPPTPASAHFIQILHLSRGSPPTPLPITNPFSPRNNLHDNFEK